MPHTKTKERKNETKNKIDQPAVSVDRQAGRQEAEAPIILPELEEKAIEEDAPVVGVEDEESEDAPSLDEEDLNPFGDKWEQ